MRAGSWVELQNLLVLFLIRSLIRVISCMQAKSMVFPFGSRKICRVNASTFDIHALFLSVCFDMYTLERLDLARRFARVCKLYVALHALAKRRALV